MDYKSGFVRRLCFEWVRTNVRTNLELIQSTGEGGFNDKVDAVPPYPPFGSAPHPWSLKQDIYVVSYTIKTYDSSNGLTQEVTTNKAGNFYLDRRFQDDHWRWESEDPGYGAPYYWTDYTNGTLSISIQLVYHTYANLR